LSWRRRLGQPVRAVVRIIAQQVLPYFAGLGILALGQLHSPQPVPGLDVELALGMVLEERPDGVLGPLSQSLEAGGGAGEPSIAIAQQDDASRRQERFDGRSGGLRLEVGAAEGRGGAG